MILKSAVRKLNSMHYPLKSKNWKKRLRHYTTRNLSQKKLETAEMSLTGVLDVIFETEEEEEKEYG